MNAMYIYTYCMVCYVLVYLGYDELYLFPYVYTYICLSYVILDCIYIYIYIYAYAHILYCGIYVNVYVCFMNMNRVISYVNRINSN